MPEPTDVQYNMDEPTIDEMQIRRHVKFLNSDRVHKYSNRILIEKTMNTWMFAALCLIILAVFCPGISQPMPDPTDFQYNMDEPTIDEMQIRNYPRVPNLFINLKKIILTPLIFSNFIFLIIEQMRSLILVTLLVVATVITALPTPYDDLDIVDDRSLREKRQFGFGGPMMGGFSPFGMGGMGRMGGMGGWGRPGWGGGWGRPGWGGGYGWG
ncbi:hypothetical protein NECAME_13847 [Necator americanus]|uniref:Uncharacterized protein n=1 Tax=Necator americanus TaxID=51031 RepID=W2SUV2_NECAM|nr:hypothetical protein NECAME_13847 [Necator americanus]ETN72482.1 hypothetical protein NECAME_13847 [Necator americanus]